jgi:hypothetical protein
LAVVGVREAEELAVAGEPEALAARGVVGAAVAPACGILARPEEEAAKALARVDPAAEVAPQVGLAVEAEELAGLVEAVRGVLEEGVELEVVVRLAAELEAGELQPPVARLLLRENG